MLHVLWNMNMNPILQQQHQQEQQQQQDDDSIVP